MFKLVLPWLWPWEFEKPEVEEFEWESEQEKIRFVCGQTPESPHDKMLRLSPSFGDLKRLVL